MTSEALRINQPLLALGPFELRLLATIRGLGEEAWGSALRAALSQSLGRDVAIGQLYLALGRLEGRGFVVSEIQEPEARRGGRSKKLFRLEALGERALVEATTSLGALLSEITNEGLQPA